MQFFETLQGRILLITVVVIVWGVNVVSFSNLKEESVLKQNNTSVEFIDVELPQINSYTYTQIDRNPFIKNTFQTRVSRPVTQEPSIVEEKMPVIQLIGVMGETSILKLENGQTVILEPGETIIGQVVLDKDFQDSVHILFNQKTYTIKLNN